MADPSANGEALGNRDVQGSPGGWPPHAIKRRRSTSTVSSHQTDDLEIDIDDHTSDPTTPFTPLTPQSPRRLAERPAKKQRPLKYFCDFEGCAKKFNRPCRLEEHKRSHTNERLFKCTHSGCDKDFLRQSHLKHHLKSAHSTVRDYICDWNGCHKSFATGTRMRNHRATHEKENSFQCNQYPPCDRSFRKHGALQRHIAADHLQLKAHSCEHLDQSSGEMCNAQFDKISELRDHEAKMHGQAYFMCSLCRSTDEQELEISFGTMSELQSHIKTAHPPFCPHCQLVCSSESELRNHIESQHRSETLEERKRYPCLHPGCGKYFTKQYNLSMHMRTVHTKEKPFKCGVTDVKNVVGLESWNPVNHCNKSYTAKHALVSHIKQYHLSGESTPKIARKGQQSKMSSQSLASLAKTPGLEEAEPRRYIACVDPNCSFRFKRRVDAITHARAAHAMTETDATEAFMEREALEGGKFWIGGLDMGEDDFTGLDRDAVEVGRPGRDVRLQPHAPRNTLQEDAEMAAMLDNFVQDHSGATASIAIDPALEDLH